MTFYFVLVTLLSLIAIGHCDLLTITLVAIIYLLSLFIGVHLVQAIVLAYILHPICFIDFESD
jgi:hypothetical protein